MLREVLQDTRVDSFWKLLNAYDCSLSMHSYSVASVSARLAMKLGFSEEAAREIYVGGLLHDIGKIGISRSILDKPAALLPGEYEQIKQHTLLGCEMAEGAGFSDVVVDICRHHHEFEDGSGYPDGVCLLRPETRLVSIVDKYDAIRKKRPYKHANSHVDTLRILEEVRSRYQDADEVFELLCMCGDVGVFRK